MQNKFFQNLFLLLFLTITSAQTNNFQKNYNYKHSSVKNSALATGTWYKFAIDTTGIYKIDKAFLKKLGVNTNNLNPDNIRILGNGGALLPTLNRDFRHDGLQENSLYITGAEDGVFNDNDYILFYGKGPESWDTNIVEPINTRHINNIYEDKAYYFLSVDSGNGKRIENANEILGNPLETISTYDDYHIYEEDLKNLFANGQQWFGKELSFDHTATVNFNFEKINPNAPLFVRVRGAAISSTSSQMVIALNGQELTKITFTPLSNLNALTLARSGEAVKSTQINTSSIEISVTFQNNGNPSAKAYLDYIEVIGSKLLEVDTKTFSFRSFKAANYSTEDVLRYEISNSQNLEMVWNVTNHLNPTLITNKAGGNVFSFNANGGNREFIAIANNSYLQPTLLDKSIVENQNLHSLQNIDYLIVTRDFLMPQAERLAEFHRQNSNLTCKVVNLEHIYNEFSSGSADLTAIRDFVRHLYLNASEPNRRIKYLCLFGDASFDFKDRINQNNNIVPAVQSFESFNLARSYVTDDYYGMMDDTDGNLNTADTQEVATGRYLVTSVQQAKDMVDKTLSYYQENAFGAWRNRITFVADDPDAIDEFVLQQTVENLADSLAAKRPVFNLTKIYADAYTQEISPGGERYPKVNDAIDNAFETGSLVVNYFGHGGEAGWALERILEVQQINNWYHPNNLPLLITITCEFSRFDNPLRVTAGEDTFLNTSGGAVAMITTTREVFISVGQRYNKILFEKLFGYNGEDYTMAEALMQMKNDERIPNSNQRFFVYFLGDPAMKLALPQPNIQLLKINDSNITQQTDTLKALSKINLKGKITDADNNVLDNYNGTLETVIYDKPLVKTTLDNNNFGKKMDFDAIESKIFTGKATVQNGEFSFDFIVPKDIRVAYGKAKISLYASNKNSDKAGYNNTLTIGGINNNAPEDNTGPTIKLYMDDESFMNGGNTSESPTLLAILEDESGINTSITAVDHDIIAILDGDQANPVILNDFYETELDNFTKGKVSYPFRNLEPGLHTLTFKCWDTYNNSSEATLDFVVVDNSDLVLSNVLNYPNPFINYTEFWFNHNKPNEPLSVQVQIFTVSGKLIKTIHKTVQSASLSRSVTWNGLDDFGNKIGKGVYIYKLKVESTLSNSKNEKVEKLVILQ
ncbi:MAG: hypothetical protein CSA39_06735 [Flavobacteriales bacterium]|nr:MAG: hypothetical protein CSA39_06735 [Flavobacteriales bacterium]